MDLPYATADLPGTGGLVKAVPEDFRVDEIPSYLPSGSGEHLYLHVEKRGLNTRDVVLAIARALSVSEREVGVAGQKDRHALTTQWISVLGATPEKAEGLSGEGFRILEATLHGNKLRLGHLKGNRFQIRLRGVRPGALEAARAVADALRERGLPNFYGPQRFGRFGDNAEVGRLLLLGLGDNDHRARRAARDRNQRRFLISAFQSDIFNRTLAARLSEGSWDRPMEGDILQKLGSGGLFVCEDPLADTPRVQSFECSVTGPMPGSRVRPEPTGEPAALEAQILAETGVGPEHLAKSREAEGTRRAFRIPVDVAVESEGEDLLLGFDLPPGSYATTVLREVIKAELPRDLDG